MRGDGGGPVRAWINAAWNVAGGPVSALLALIACAGILVFAIRADQLRVRRFSGADQVEARLVAIERRLDALERGR